MSEAKVLVVYVTCPQDKAEALAETLVQEKLVACVNILPRVTSVYSWQGEVVKDEESLLVMKTSTDFYARLEARVKALHSYEVPEVLALPVEKGSKEYIGWLLGSLEK